MRLRVPVAVQACWPPPTVALACEETVPAHSQAQLWAM